MDDAKYAKIVALIGLAGLALQACGGPGPGQDLAGREVFADHCAACHVAETTNVAPGLAGLMGRVAGTADFPYSEAFRTAGFTWDAAQLEAFLADPRAVVPGNRMAFWGLPSPGDRDALVAYLGGL